MEITELKNLSVSDHLNLDDIESMDPNDLLRFESRSGLKLSLLAAEKGHERAMRALIDRGFDVDTENDGRTPIEVAFANKHYKVVHKLLQANSRFPKNFECSDDAEELKNFVEITKTLHESIETDNEEKICEIIKENPSMKHFYNLDNESAVKVALEGKKLEIYKLLISQKVYIGPHEEMFVIVRPLGRKFRRELREIHTNLSKCIISKPMMTIAKNCFIGPDVPEQEENYNFIHNALHYLFKIPSIAKYLEVVAASRKFRIVFDFNRETVEYLDPSAEPYTNGLFYSSGKIFIGAKNMLDPLKKFEVYSVIAHELCHYAMFLVWNNHAKPYKVKDELAAMRFEKIIKLMRYVDDEVIRSVFDNYHENFYHAEMVVRAPQLLVLYHECPEVLERKEELKPLLEYFEEEVVPKVESELPKVKSKFLSENQKKIKRQEKIIFSLGSILAIFVMLSIPLGFWLYTPNYDWKTMSENEKLKFNDALISYHGVKVKFERLFQSDSEIFDHLTSELIDGALNGDASFLSKEINSVYDDIVFLNWSNMTEELRTHLMEAEINFQGSIIKISKILSSNSSAFNLLNANQIRACLSGRTFNVSSEIERKSMFFFKRRFIPDDDDDYLFKEHFAKTFEQVFDEVKNTKTFLLSSPAGEGKSTTLRYFWFELKKKTPEKWIAFFDLKKHIETFEKEKDLNITDKTVLTNFLAGRLLKLQDFEGALFVELFELGKVVFIWDGIDEISPFFTQMMKDLVAKITELSSNHQYMSTRPQHSKEYQRRLDIKAYKFVPLNRQERFTFLTMSLAVLLGIKTPAQNSNITKESFIANIESSKKYNESTISKLQDAFVASEQIFKNIQAYDGKKNFVENLLLIFMVAQIATSEKISLDRPMNLYELYDIFIDKKLIIVSHKGKLVQDDKRKIEKNPALNHMQIHQKLALKIMWNEGFSELDKLNFFANYEKVKNHEISRYGIMTIVSDKDFEFIHRTFVEFFFVQFLVFNVNSVQKLSCFVQKFNEILLSPDMKVVRKFLYGYLENEESISSDILAYALDHKLLMENIMMEMPSNLVYIVGFCNYANFIENHKLLSQHASQNFINHELFFYKSSSVKASCSELLQKWDLILETIGLENFGRFFTSVVYKIGNSFIHIYFLLCNENVAQIFEKLNESFGYDFFLEVFFKENKYNETALINALPTSHFNLPIIWTSLEKILKPEDQKRVLKMEKDTLGILEIVVNDLDFKFALSLYLRVFPRSELIEYLLRDNEPDLKPILYYHYGMRNHHLSNPFEEIIKFTDKLFDGNTTEMEKFLNYEMEDETTLFSYFSLTEDPEIQNYLKNLKALYETNATHNVSLP